MLIWCVVDCDPHGVDIMRMFKYGSRSLGHEANARVSGLQWLGVRMDDVLGTSATPPSGHSTDSMVALTGNDRKTAQRILGNITSNTQEELDAEQSEQVRELQLMLMLNLKAEIQAIDDMGDLSTWLDNKMVAI